MRDLLESEKPFVSPVVELELTYLYKIGRVTEPAEAPLTALRKTIGLETADASLAALVEAAAKLSWTRDPFDCMISAQAIVAGAPLLTADRTILANLSLATWN